MQLERSKQDNNRVLSVDIAFKNLGYKANNGKSGRKLILDEQNGTFYGGNLTGILGSSGAGKSTLLNILAGYIDLGVSGDIYINGEPREITSFKKISTYIMQEDLLQSHLTVREYIMFAIKLKMSPSLSITEREAIVSRVTETLGMTSCLDTRSERLSGGQRKRLSIAVELVNNPPVIFLDEPTTGLDQVAVKQCVELLKSLARQGKTVICTIHQPSDSVFALFDHVYFMDSGQCIYNDTVDGLLPYLSYAGFNCPKTYNPADYIIELTQLQPETIQNLAKHAKTNRYYRKHTEDYRTETSAKFESKTLQLGFWMQFFVLLERSILQLVRNRTSLFMMFLHHVISGIVVGVVFYGVGKDAALIYLNFKFCMVVLIYIVYSYAIVPSLTYPSEVKLVKREYFNGWYSLKAYFLARVLIPTMMMIVTINIFAIIAYTLADQPMEFKRYFLFVIPVILVGLNSTSFGLAIGALFNSKNGAAITPATLAPLVVLSVYGMGFGKYMDPYMNVVINLAYFRYGIVAVCGTMFEDRQDLECNDVYCHYKDTDLFLKDMGMYGSSYLVQIFALLGFVAMHMLAGYFLLRVKFSSNFMERIKNMRSYL